MQRVTIIYGPPYVGKTKLADILTSSFVFEIDKLYDGHFMNRWHKTATLQTNNLTIGFDDELTSLLAVQKTKQYPHLDFVFTYQATNYSELKSKIKRLLKNIDHKPQLHFIYLTK